MFGNSRIKRKFAGRPDKASISSTTFPSLRVPSRSSKGVPIGTALSVHGDVAGAGCAGKIKGRMVLNCPRGDRVVLTKPFAPKTVSVTAYGSDEINVSC